MAPKASQPPTQPGQPWTRPQPWGQDQHKMFPPDATSNLLVLEFVGKTLHRHMSGRQAHSTQSNPGSLSGAQTLARSRGKLDPPAIKPFLPRCRAG